MFKVNVKYASLLASVKCFCRPVNMGVLIWRLSSTTCKSLLVKCGLQTRSGLCARSCVSWERLPWDCALYWSWSWRLNSSFCGSTSGGAWMGQLSPWSIHHRRGHLRSPCTFVQILHLNLADSPSLSGATQPLWRGPPSIAPYFSDLHLLWPFPAFEWGSLSTEDTCVLSEKTS